MSEKEATARIKINKLLESAGWRFFPEGTNPANARLEPSIAIRSVERDALGSNLEKAGKGFVDFLLLDAKGFPLIVLEAKAEHPIWPPIPSSPPAIFAPCRRNTGSSCRNISRTTFH
jgi:type I site-specific restriction endonuclease